MKSKGEPTKNLTVPLPLAVLAVVITAITVAVATKRADVLAQSRSSYDQATVI